MQVPDVLHMDIDTGLLLPNDPDVLRTEIDRVQSAVADVDGQLAGLPPRAISTLPVSQLLIRNSTEVGLMSEGDLLQEIANVNAGLLDCHTRLMMSPAAFDEALRTALANASKELERISERDRPGDDDAIYCLCRLPYNSSRSMIQCDICDDWFHLTCVGLSLLALPEHFVCPMCTAPIGSQGRRHRRSDAGSIPDISIQPELDQALLDRGSEWMRIEIRAVSADLATIVAEIDQIDLARDVEAKRHARITKREAKSRRAAEESVASHEPIIIRIRRPIVTASDTTDDDADSDLTSFGNSSLAAESMLNRRDTQSIAYLPSDGSRQRRLRLV